MRFLYSVLTSTLHSTNCYLIAFGTLTHFGHFPGEPGLAGCPLNSPSPFTHNCASVWLRPNRSMSFSAQSHQVFFRRSVCLIHSTSHVIQHLNQSLSSFPSTCPNRAYSSALWHCNNNNNNNNVTYGNWFSGTVHSQSYSACRNIRMYNTAPQNRVLWRIFCDHKLALMNLENGHEIGVRLCVGNVRIFQSWSF